MAEEVLVADQLRKELLLAEGMEAEQTLMLILPDMEEMA
jgi:hypothetical protein